MKYKYLKSNEWKSSFYASNRDRMPLAESILYEGKSEVHPGADFVKVVYPSQIR